MRRICKDPRDEFGLGENDQQSWICKALTVKLTDCIQLVAGGQDGSFSGSLGLSSSAVANASAVGALDWQFIAESQIAYLKDCEIPKQASVGSEGLTDAGLEALESVIESVSSSVSLAPRLRRGDRGLSMLILSDFKGYGLESSFRFFVVSNFSEYVSSTDLLRFLPTEELPSSDELRILDKIGEACAGITGDMLEDAGVDSHCEVSGCPGGNGVAEMEVVSNVIGVLLGVRLVLSVMESSRPT
ncbi:hypothetical protein X801_07632 [Opisthorchis viverrini]|uniref:Uncharacterized protein n=1 Tax=Opisthorchis viverrini TaxID=6198 RepID=A0A1S8WQN1_OPIVI|nr:hypothetical protein X801_07632 [Opisthorchis viverrini]